MTTLTPAAHPRRGRGRRLLGSPFVDLLLGPHGVDRYLELIRPSLTVRDARAEVIARPPPDRAQRHPDAAAQRAPGTAFAPASSSAPASRSTACAGPAPTRRPAPSTARRARARADRDRASRGAGLPPPARAACAPARSSTSAPAQGDFVLPDPRPRAAGADQRRQRHHAGDVDAAHAVRRGPRGRDHVPALRPDRRPTGCTSPRSGSWLGRHRRRRGVALPGARAGSTARRPSRRRGTRRRRRLDAGPRCAGRRR